MPFGGVAQPPSLATSPQRKYPPREGHAAGYAAGLLGLSDWRVLEAQTDRGFAQG